jgi:hypothetical protein
MRIAQSLRKNLQGNDNDSLALLIAGTLVSSQSRTFSFSVVGWLRRVDNFHPLLERFGMVVEQVDMSDQRGASATGKFACCTAIR